MSTVSGLTLKMTMANNFNRCLTDYLHQCCALPLLNPMWQHHAIVPTSENFTAHLRMALLLPELTSAFWVPWNEMWRWYTARDETSDRGRNGTEVTKDIHPCLTARHWHNVAWNTVQPTLFSGGSAHAAKSPYFHPNIMKPQCLSNIVMLPEC